MDKKVKTGSIKKEGGEKVKSARHINGIEVNSTPTSLTNRNWKFIGAGIFVLLLGFLVLTRADSEGRNWASITSPFLIIGAYVIIAIGIILPPK